MKKSLGLGLLAIADEVWRTEEFSVIYAEDRGKTAIWEYGNGEGTVFIDGLAGEYENRGSYKGYWVQETSSRRCDTFREDANGQKTYHWGNVTVDFIDADFPSRWTLNLGVCDGPAFIELNGIPIVK